MSGISYSGTTAYSYISSALSNNYLVGADTASSPPYGLVSGHAHTVVGTYQLKDQNGNVQYNMVRIRNPWGVDKYTGPWCDGDSRWTAAYQAQVPYNNN